MIPTTNELLKQNVIDQLTWDTSVNANQVFVKVNDGRVELTGQVRNLAAKVAAERNAYEVNGVTEVDNRLEISFPPETTALSDNEIKQNAESMLSWNQDINPEYIELHCKKGVVTLTGKVESFKEKHQAADLVVTLEGVLDVDNQLEVSPAKDILDYQIYKEITDTFRRARIIDESKLIAEVDIGKVTLKGQAATYFEKMHARNIAIHTNGVTNVIDKIEIAYS